MYLYLSSPWIVLPCGGAVIHLFSNEKYTDGKYFLYSAFVALRSQAYSPLFPTHSSRLFSLIRFLLTWLKCVGYAWKIILAATFPSVQSTMLCVKLYAYSPNVISLESALWKKSGEYDWKLSALSATPAFWSLPHGALLNEAKSCIHTTSHSRQRDVLAFSHTRALHRKVHE